MSEVKLTPEQNEAIHSSGKNILVSASAGSGKTFVMAQRIVEKVKQGIEIDRLFISTFTKKAASELRMRLERDLKKARQESSDENQARRLTLALQNLSNADIGTMDSFTQKLTKTNFNRVNIDPNFRILADQTESDLIRQEVFEQLVESYLSEDDGLNISKEKFEELIKNFSKDRNIAGFQKVVYTTYRFASATENPIKWLENQFLKGFETYKSLTDLSADFSADIKENLLIFFELLETSLTNGVIAKKGAGRDKANLILDNKNELLEAITTKDFATFTELFLSIDTDILDESTWLNSWQQYIEPTEILPNIVIKPAWQDYDNVDNKTIIEIDSDISFGTGSHETTKTCAELLKNYSVSMELDKVTCLDIGTGTGVLLLVAAQLGIKHLVGIDIEEYAANQAKINCANNKVHAEIICGDLDRDFNGKANLILANLTVDPLKILLPQIGRKLEDNGIFNH